VYKYFSSFMSLKKHSAIAVDEIDDLVFEITSITKNLISTEVLFLYSENLLVCISTLCHL